MMIEQEQILFSEDQWFRIIRWDRSIEELCLMRPGGYATPIPGMGARWHRHPQAQLTVFSEGRGVWTIGDHVGSFEAPTVVFLGGGLPHSWIEDGETSGWILQFDVDSGSPLWNVGGTEELKRLLNEADQGLRIPSSSVDWITAMLEELTPAAPLIRTGLVFHLLGKMAHAAYDRDSRLSSCRGTNFQEVDPAIERVVGWLFERFAEPIQLQDAIEQSAMSRATFCRRFARYTGKSFVTFLTEIRLARARQLLLHSNRTVADIAFKCGFGSLTRFNAAFRDRFQMAPREARRRSTSQVERKTDQAC